MIKKILTGLFLLPIIFANAQENKNKFVVNANLALFYGGNYPLGLGGFNFGYFLTDHFSIGITGNYDAYKDSRNYKNDVSNYHSLNKNDRTDNFAGAFARYNFSPKNKFAFFLSLENAYFWNKFKEEYVVTTVNGVEISSIYEGSTKGNTVSLSPGIVYFIHPKFSAEIGLGSVYYSIRKQYGMNSAYSKINGFGTNFFTSGLNIGVSYYFGCKNKNQEN
jgi:hypothetical protein